MSQDQVDNSDGVLCQAIRYAMALADGQGKTLIGALLAEALDAADCDEEDVGSVPE